MSLLLPLASAALLGVVALQDYLVPALRQKTISSGLTGPYGNALLGAFVVLAVALWLTFNGHSVGRYVADMSAVALVLTGLSGKFTTRLDKYMNGEKAHTICTAVTFVLAIALQFLMNGHSVPLWSLTIGGMLFPVATHFLVPNASVTEKIGVTQLCVWLAAYSL